MSTPNHLQERRDSTQPSVRNDEGESQLSDGYDPVLVQKRAVEVFFE